MKFLTKINWRSVAKAAKEVGLGAAGVAVPVGLAFLSEPEVFTSLVVALGPVGLVAAPLLPFAIKYLRDAWKHQDEN